MNIFYKRVKVWAKWPDNDQTEYDMVHFSRQKKKFDDHIFLKLDPQIQTKERLIEIGSVLNVKSKNLTLIKL